MSVITLAHPDRSHLTWHRNRDPHSVIENIAHGRSKDSPRFFKPSESRPKVWHARRACRVRFISIKGGWPSPSCAFESKGPKEGEKGNHPDHRDDYVSS